MRKKNKPSNGVELNKSTENKILETFGTNLKKIREKKSFSQESVAYASGLSRNYYADVEQGRRNLSLINIVKIATALKVELNKLISIQEIEKYIIK